MSDLNIPGKFASALRPLGTPAMLRGRFWVKGIQINRAHTHAHTCISYRVSFSRFKLVLERIICAILSATSISIERKEKRNFFLKDGRS